MEEMSGGVNMRKYPNVPHLRRNCYERKCEGREWKELLGGRNLRREEFENEIT